jgi:hypothetical protein
MLSSYLGMSYDCRLLTVVVLLLFILLLSWYVGLYTLLGQDYGK